MVNITDDLPYFTGKTSTDPGVYVWPVVVDAVVVTVLVVASPQSIIIFCVPDVLVNVVLIEQVASPRSQNKNCTSVATSVIIGQSEGLEYTAGPVVLLKKFCNGRLNAIIIMLEI